MFAELLEVFLVPKLQFGNALARQTPVAPTSGFGQSPPQARGGRGGKKRADLTMIVRPEMRRFQLLDMLIEFKYLSLSDVNLSGAEIRAMSQGELKTGSLGFRRVNCSKGVCHPRIWAEIDPGPQIRDAGDTPAWSTLQYLR